MVEAADVAPVRLPVGIYRLNNLAAVAPGFDHTASAQSLCEQVMRAFPGDLVGERVADRIDEFMPDRCRLPHRRQFRKTEARYIAVAEPRVVRAHYLLADLVQELPVITLHGLGCRL